MLTIDPMNAIDGGRDQEVGACKKLIFRFPVVRLFPPRFNQTGISTSSTTSSRRGARSAQSHRSR
jgi:hypothetical protein